MHKLFVFAAALLVLTATVAVAAGQGMNGLTLCGLQLPCTSELSCVGLDLSCGPCPDAGRSMDQVAVEFLAADGSLLGLAALDGPWCDPCTDCGIIHAPINPPVNPADVKYVRITKPGEDDLDINWFKLTAGYEGQCCKSKWFTLFECCAPVVLGNDVDEYQAIVLM